jgi:DNA-cytosine methyltransferase
MNVLSLFDGMSCGQIALDKLGIKVDNYFASEVDKYAMQITMKNYPNTKQIGSVVDVKGEDLPKIDLLFGGSPCQNLSRATINNIKHNGGLMGSKSSLFYEYLRVLTETKPKFFLLENVGGMSNENKNLISEALEVEPIHIDSNLLSAQDRSRLYWTNIPNIKQPKDKGFVLADICVKADDVDSKYWYEKDFTYNGDDKKVQATLHINGHDILKRVNNLNNKSATLTCCRGGNLQKKVFQNGKCRKLMPLEYERLQTAPDNYTFGVSDSQRYNMLGNGWTVDVIAHIFSQIPQM